MLFRSLSFAGSDSSVSVGLLGAAVNGLSVADSIAITVDGGSAVLDGLLNGGFSALLVGGNVERDEQNKVRCDDSHP